MSTTVARELLREMAPGSEASPLALIGVSAEILSLGLTDDELFDICKKFARVMLAAVHEDRVTPTPRTAYLQRRFSDALVSLRDRDTFKATLNALIRQRSVEASETNRLRRDMEDAFRRMRDVEVEAATAEVRFDRRLRAHKNALSQLYRKAKLARDQAVQALADAHARVREKTALKRKSLRNRSLSLRLRAQRLDAKLADVRAKKTEQKLLVSWLTGRGESA